MDQDVEESKAIEMTDIQADRAEAMVHHEDIEEPDVAKNLKEYQMDDDEKNVM